MSQSFDIRSLQVSVIDNPHYHLNHYEFYRIKVHVLPLDLGHLPGQPQRLVGFTRTSSRIYLRISQANHGIEGKAHDGM